MRKDHYSTPSKWTKEFRQALKLGDVHFKVYAYLEGGIESHPTGIYFVTLSAIAEMVREDRDLIGPAMEDLEEVGLIVWDQAADVVYVPCVCAEQYRWGSRSKSDPARDFRLIEAKRHISALPATRLVEMFLYRWPVFAPDQGATQGAMQAPTQGACIGATPSTCSFSSSNPPPRAPRRADRSKTDQGPAIFAARRQRARHSRTSGGAAHEAVHHNGVSDAGWCTTGRNGMIELCHHGQGHRFGLGQRPREIVLIGSAALGEVRQSLHDAAPDRP